jgi:hypothetical protein
MLGGRDLSTFGYLGDCCTSGRRCRGVRKKPIADGVAGGRRRLARRRLWNRWTAGPARGAGLSQVGIGQHRISLLPEEHGRGRGRRGQGAKSLMDREMFFGEARERKLPSFAASLTVAGRTRFIGVKTGAARQWAALLRQGRDCGQGAVATRTSGPKPNPQ